jgi:hypothetical protein
MTDTRLKYAIRLEKHAGPLSDAMRITGWRSPFQAASKGSAVLGSATFEFPDAPAPDWIQSVRASLGEDWLITESGWTAITPLPMTRIHPDEARDLLLEAEKMLDDVGIRGGEWVTQAPTGWTRIIYIYASHLVDIAQRAPKGSQMRIDCVKEKFGTLRIYSGQTGLPKELASEFEKIVFWAQSQSHDRCIMTGTPGQHEQVQHWLTTISLDARELYESDRDRFNQMTWPLAKADMLD